MSGISFDSLLERLGPDPISDAGILRARLVPELKRALDDGRTEAERMLLEDGKGLGCARRLSSLMDATVELVHEAVVRHLYPAHNPTSSERLAVVATGGYGRGTLAPGS